MFANNILCALYGICLEEEAGSSKQKAEGGEWEDNSPPFMEGWQPKADGVITAEQGSLLETITLVPNPTTGELRIENGELRINNVEFYDIMGKKQKIIVNYQLSTVNCSHLPSGIYFVKITTETGNIIKKVVKQ